MLGPRLEAEGMDRHGRSSRRLATAEGNLNSVVGIARGRLVDEDLLPRVSSAELYSKYVTGQVEADFLDLSTAEDIVTSSRQRLMEDNDRVAALLALLKTSMREVEQGWNRLRTKDKTSALRSRYPNLGSWLGELPEGWRTKAEKLLERIATLELGESDGEGDSRATLLRHAVFGFERLRLRGDAEELEQALGAGVDSLLRLLAGKDGLEASLYRDIVRSRLDVIRKLQAVVEADARERVLQDYLFDHLWLLDPSWERAAGSGEKERRLRLVDAFKDDDETKERYGRVDIRYRTVAGKHVIVELKRASVRPSIFTLGEQGAKYVDATRATLPQAEQATAHIEVVFVVGRAPSDPPDRVENVMNGVAAGSRIVTYDLLIEHAREAYASYLAGSRSADRIDQLMKTEGDETS